MFTENIVHINVSTKEFFTESLSQHNFIGGTGLATFLFHREFPKGSEALSEDNVVVIAIGPAQLAAFPFSGRHCIVTKSPLTNCFIDSHAGGYIGHTMAKLGITAIVIKGSSYHPLHIAFSDKGVEFYDASHLWGRKTSQTEIQVKKDLSNNNIHCMKIGPAGENQVLFASVINDRFRAAGRGGIGAVFGSKKIKVISMQSKNSIIKPTNVVYKETTKEILNRTKNSRNNNHKMFFQGTSWLVNVAQALDMLPTRNYAKGQYEQVDTISGDTFHGSFKTKKNNCALCPLGCAHVIDKPFYWANQTISMPEYETIAMCGSNLELQDKEAIIHINHLCNELGLDTISTGNTLGFLMECFERNIVPKTFAKEKISFGSPQGLLELIYNIAFKKGLGEYAAKGTKYLADFFGSDSDNFAIHVKGLEMAAWDPRGKKGLGMSYATSAVGASHLRGWPKTMDVPNDVAIETMDSMVNAQDFKIIKDSLILCHFTHSLDPPLDMDLALKIYNGCVDENIDLETFQLMAKKIWMLQRLFNYAEFGSSLNDLDVLPPRLLNDPLPAGPAKGCRAFVSSKDFDECRQRVYSLRALDHNGVPTKDELQRLGLKKM